MNSIQEFLDQSKAWYTESPEFSYYELDHPERFLNFCVKHGYVLHGSTRTIKGKLNPHQSNDLSKEFGNQKGVYLTDIPIVAMFASLTGGANIGVSRSSVQSKYDQAGTIQYPEHYFAVAKPENIQASGFVYIFPRKVVDDSEGSEYIAKKSIQPEVVIKIQRKDFRFNIEKIDSGAKRGT